jgi:hypothetical protein
VFFSFFVVFSRLLSGGFLFSAVVICWCVSGGAARRRPRLLGAFGVDERGEASVEDYVKAGGLLASIKSVLISWRGIGVFWLVKIRGRPRCG